MTHTIENAYHAAPTSGCQTIADPSTGTDLVDHPEAGIADLDRAVAAARAGFPGWAATGWLDRGAALRRFADLIEAHATALAWTVASETGRPLRRAWSEVAMTGDYLRIVAGHEPPDRTFDRPGVQATLGTVRSAQSAPSHPGTRR